VAGHNASAADSRGPRELTARSNALLAGRISLSPVTRHSALVGDGQDEQFSVQNAVDNPEREIPDDRSSHRSSKWSAGLGKHLDSINDTLNPEAERPPETNLSRFVESGSLIEFGRRLRVKASANHPRRRRRFAKTSSPGMEATSPRRTCS
jgi:hypothetical protein